MKIRRFFAPDMRRAIQLVRAEHGADAVILSSRAVDGGMEIISAVDYDEELVAQMFQPRARARGDEAPEIAASAAPTETTPSGAAEREMAAETPAAAAADGERSAVAANVDLSEHAALAARADAALAAVERLAGAATDSAAAVRESLTPTLAAGGASE